MNNKAASCPVLIVAGGQGIRMGDEAGSLPKQFQPLVGLTVIEHSLHRLSVQPGIGQLFVAVQKGQQHMSQTHTTPFPTLRILETAGETRQATVRQSLEAIAAAGDIPQRIAIHDAARPCWTPALLQRLLKTPGDATVPALRVPDSLRRITEGQPTGPVDRSGIHAIQTPQIFNFSKLLELHRRFKDKPVDDDSALFEQAGETVTYVAGERNNLKITLPQDMDDAAAVLAMHCGDIRTATGYDVHEFTAATPDRPLRLGGVSVPHDKPLKGHSDADVVLHAITDALLGCIAAQDIGHHFSPRDMRWKDADSAQFLAHAAGMITGQGGLIMHVDATVICEEPKIGPHRAAMQAVIADILKVDRGRVSIKATTSEGLGFTGRREGIAAQAAATVRLPFNTFIRTESKQHASQV